jgi:putative addiction module killer protein
MLHWEHGMFEIQSTNYFDEWYAKQEAKTRAAIYSRIKFVKEHGLMLHARYLGEKLFEFKWKIGIRVYFTIKHNKLILLLSGGKKNGQEQDIQKARDILRAFTL